MRMRVPLFRDMMETVMLGRGFPVPMSIQRVMDGDDPDLDFNTPRLVAKTRKTSMLVAGDIVEYQDGHYIVARRSHTPDYNSYWLFQANRQVTWKRKVTVKDPLTNLDKSESLDPVGPDIWVAWEIMSRQPVDRELGLSNEVTRVLTVEDVQIGDVLNGQQVKRLNKSFGVTIAEVQ